MGKRRGLPPLGALAAFDSAARHANFAAAAEEMSLTPAAISYQVRLMEEWAGKPLFERRPNGVGVTEAGKELGRRVQVLLDEVIALGAQVRAQREPQQVVIRCQFSLATRWLAGKVVEFQRAYPDFNVQVRAEPAMTDALAGRADMAIYYPGPHDPPEGTPLIGGRFVVVAAPAFLDQCDCQTGNAAAITNSRLIHFIPKDRGWPEPAWATWFRSAGLKPRLAGPSITASMMNVAIEMCIAGGGLALVHEPLVLDDLAAGRLVLAHPLAIPAPHTYHLRVRASSAVRPEVKALESFLLRQAIV